MQNTEENVGRFKLSNVEVRESSVFTAIGQEKADVIFFHPPFHHEKVPTDHTKLMNSVSTDGFKVLDQFFEGVRDYLQPNGKIYLGFSNKDQESLDHLEYLMKDFKVLLITHEYVESSADWRFYEISIA